MRSGIASVQDFSGMFIVAILAACLTGCSSNPPSAPQQHPLPLALSARQKMPPAQILPIEGVVTIGTHSFNLEVARTRAQQATGLMYRRWMPDDRAMLFPFNPPQPVSFWMKNVILSLDMVFVRNGIVLEIAAEVPPCQQDPCPTYGPADAVDQVIELRGGRAKALQLKKGDPVTIRWTEKAKKP
jgi:uncharacterized protein